MKVISLDFDGVLNGHEWCHLGHKNVRSINTPNVVVLNKILEVTGAKIIVHSTWVGKILSNQLTDKGFEWMLKSHGVIADVIGHVAQVPQNEKHRATLIKDWMTHHSVEKFLVIDDLNVPIRPLIRPDPGVGLIPYHVHVAQKFLE